MERQLSIGGLLLLVKKFIKTLFYCSLLLPLKGYSQNKTWYIEGQIDGRTKCKSPISLWVVHKNNLYTQLMVPVGGSWKLALKDKNYIIEARSQDGCRAVKPIRRGDNLTQVVKLSISK